MVGDISEPKEYVELPSAAQPLHIRRAGLVGYRFQNLLVVDLMPHHQPGIGNRAGFAEPVAAVLQQVQFC